jgi:hypothetical protein
MPRDMTERLYATLLDRAATHRLTLRYGAALRDRTRRDGAALHDETGPSGETTCHAMKRDMTERLYGAKQCNTIRSGQSSQGDA